MNHSTKARSFTVLVALAVLLGSAAELATAACGNPRVLPPKSRPYGARYAGAAFFIDRVTALEVEVDGVPLENLFTYRATSRLFTFTGDPSLQFFDACFTGTPQPGVADGYWVMLAPLRPGPHTIHFRARQEIPEFPATFELEATYNLTVAAR